MNLFIIPTYSCNLSCTYCFEKRDRETKCLSNSFLDPFSEKFENDIKKYIVFNKSKKDITRQAQLHGGEPTLAPAENLLQIGRVYRKIFKDVFDENLDTVFEGMVTNGVRLLKDEQYYNDLIKNKENIRFGMALSYDLYSQTSARTPDISLKEWELFLDKLIDDDKAPILLTQISKHSLNNEKEWLEHYEYFNNKYYNKIKGIRLRFICENDFNSKEKDFVTNKELKKFINKISKLEDKLVLNGKKIPNTYYYDGYLNLESIDTIATCSITSNSCWLNTENRTNMLSYSNGLFYLGCAGATTNKRYAFDDFEGGYQKALQSYTEDYIKIRSGKCGSCKYVKNCMPCLFEICDSETIFDGTKCKKYYDVFFKR